MTIFLVVLAPLIALFVWGIIFDLKRVGVTPSLPVTASGRRHGGPRRTPTLIVRGGPNPAAGGVSDKVQCCSSCK